MARYFERDTPGWSILGDLERAFTISTVWSMWDGKKLLGCGGVTPIMPGKGAIWFLGTHRADKRPIMMTRGCRRFVAASRRDWKWLGNVVPRNMPERIKWLEHLGFDTNKEEAQRLKSEVVAFWLQSP